MSRQFVSLALWITVWCLVGCVDESITEDVTAPESSPASELKLLSPDMPLALIEDEVMFIRWYCTGDRGDYVRIDLLADDEIVYQIADSTINSGRFDWQIDYLPVGEIYHQVRVSDLTTGCADESAPVILLDPAPWTCELLMAVLFAGSRFDVGDSMRIDWVYYGEACSDSVMIELLNDSEPILEISSATENDGHYDWAVTSPRADSTGYSIRITDRISGAYTESDRGWQIVGGVDPLPTAMIELLSPNGGEVWDLDESHWIMWQSVDLASDLIDLELVLEAGGSSTIASSLPNTGSYLWSSGDLPPGDGVYRVRVIASESGLSDLSDAPFSLVRPCRYTLISPRGGQEFAPGDPCDITWQSNGACGETVDIYLTNDDGASAMILTGLPESGSFEWTVAPIGADPDGYRMCVSGAASGVSDCSPNPFSIISPCLISLMAPSPGAELLEGETVNITWFSQAGCGELVSIELLQDQELCYTIAGAASNSGSFAWIVDRCGITETGYQIRITDLTTGNKSTADGGFTILRQCGLNISEPGNAAEWIEGNDYTIRWSRVGQCSDWVAIDLMQGGIAGERIAYETENDGSFTWQAQRHLSREFGYAIRITDLMTGTERTSNGLFSILEPCRITLTAPNGGEEYIVGESVAIRWNQNHSCGDQIRIDLMRENSICRVISPLAENRGDFTWLAGDCDGVQRGYRIVLTDTRSGARDTSDASFEIYAPVFISAVATGAGMVVYTNHRDWIGQLALKFSGDGYQIGCPDWMDSHCPALLLDPGAGAGIAFYPVNLLDGGGVIIDNSCTAVEVKIEGRGDLAGGGAEMYFSSSVSEGCVWPMPVADYYRGATAYMNGYCVRSPGPVRLQYTFRESETANRIYGLTRIQYTFHGWKAR